MTIEELFNKEGQRIVKELQKSFAQAGVNASGRLSDTTMYFVTSDPSQTRLQIEINQYGTILEPGRGPTEESGNGVLYDRIREWIDDKGIATPSSFKNRDSLAWAITKKIHIEGTKAFPNKGPKVITNVIDEKLVKEIEEKVANLEEEIILRGIDSVIRTYRANASN